MIAGTLSGLPAGPRWYRRRDRKGDAVLRRRSRALPLDEIHRRLAAAREEIRVLSEQLLASRDDADDAEVRATVSENVADVREARDARGHAELLERQLRKQEALVTELEAEEWRAVERGEF